MNRTTTLVSLATVSVLSGLVAYAVYFDYKRRNDVDFRKRLYKEQKKVSKMAGKSSSSAGSQSDAVSLDKIKAALEAIRGETLPVGAEEKERYFMENVGIGEQLCTQGPAFHLPAALSFYRAMRVYPSPVELIMIYQKTVPEPVFKIFLDMTSVDVSNPSSPEPKKKKTSKAGSATGSVSGASAGKPASEEDIAEHSPVRGGPPSETSSHEWERLTDPGTHTPATGNA